MIHATVVAYFFWATLYTGTQLSILAQSLSLSIAVSLFELSLLLSASMSLLSALSISSSCGTHSSCSKQSIHTLQNRLPIRQTLAAVFFRERKIVLLLTQNVGTLHVILWAHKIHCFLHISCRTAYYRHPSSYPHLAHKPHIHQYPTVLQSHNLFVHKMTYVSGGTLNLYCFTCLLLHLHSVCCDWLPNNWGLSAQYFWCYALSGAWQKIRIFPNSAYKVRRFYNNLFINLACAASVFQ